MEYLINKDSLLQYLPFETFNTLTKSLEKQNALNKIEENCQEIYKKIEPTYRQPCRTLIEQLLANLIDMGCTIENLTSILITSQLYEAVSIFVTEQMEVLNESETTQIIQIGKEFILEFNISGIPQPKYRWYKDNILLSEETEPKIYIKQYSPKLSGNYVCEAIQTQSEETKILRSNIFKVKTLPEKCVIIKRPPFKFTVRSSAVPQEVEFVVIANGYPKPEYQWLHNNKVLPLTMPILKIKNEKKYEGIYRCRISNSVSDDIMTVTHYTVIEENFINYINMNKVSEKVALLIANQNYANNDKLKTPVNDTKALSIQLEQRGFLVLNPNNLTLKGMKNVLYVFNKMCVPDSLVFIYFSGHGFELSDKYLMPIDAPDIENMRRDDSISENEILHDILQTKPRLIVSILDMCLKQPNRAENKQIYEELPKIYKFKSDRNLIQAYSTSIGSGAFEIEEKENSLYNMILRKQIESNLTILNLFFNVNKEFKKWIDQCPTNINIKMKEQMPSLYINVAEDYRLDVSKKGDPESQKIWNYYNRKEN